MTVQIIGAGLAGLLAANMLPRHDPIIIERQTDLPNNHSAVLRFRSGVIGDIVNIPFRKVSMIKTHQPWLNPVADALMYSRKTNGTFRSDRSITKGLVADERWIAPTDLIARMASKLNIEYGEEFSGSAGAYPEPVISTVPMPILMDLLGYPKREGIEFKHIAGTNVRMMMGDCDAYVSVLIPDPNSPASRISITGAEVIMEMTGEIEPEDAKTFFMGTLRDCLGISLGNITKSAMEVSKQRYSKIAPIDDAKRKEFMFWATDKHNIYSLGRFATWRPGLLLDDLVNDIRLIGKWITDGHRYEMGKVR